MALSQTLDFYTQRADEAAAEAGTTKLANVRERALRSEKTWRGLAAQAKRVLIERAAAEIVRAEGRLAEAELAAAVAAAVDALPGSSET
jgi:hypothetical protein